MKYLIFLASFFSSALLAVENRSTTCQFGEKQRIIEIVYPEMTVTPCEVRYIKNGNTQVLWSANAELGYCESKADAFIEKQRGWGWQCDAVQTDEVEETEATEVEAVETDEPEAIESSEETEEEVETK